MAKFVEEVYRWEHKKWRFVGREVEREERGTWSEDNKDGVKSEDFYPMMEYAYPLEEKPSSEQIKKVHEETGCTVVEKRSTGKYYLALCGGGMDLSQYIALAYLITENHIPFELAKTVSTQEGLNLKGEQFKRVMKRCRRSLDYGICNAENQLEAIKHALEGK